MSTNRPSPSPKGEVSRNIVGVTEVAPNTTGVQHQVMPLTYTELRDVQFILLLYPYNSE